MAHERETGGEDAPPEHLIVAEAELPPLDAYNNSLAMPLDEFIRHPMAMGVLHNGAAFQARFPDSTNPTGDGIAPAVACRQS